MELTIEQKDALTELINIGYGRAAAALSELTGYRITLEVPRVSMHEIQAIAPLLESMINLDVASAPAGGRTLFFVSHNERDLLRFCTRGLYLDKGALVLDAPIGEVVKRYNADYGV